MDNVFEDPNYGAPQWWTESKIDPRFTLDGPLYYNFTSPGASGRIKRRKKVSLQRIQIFMHQHAKRLKTNIPEDLVWGTCS